MAQARAKTQTVDEYIRDFSPDVQAILEKIRGIVRATAPDATEKISYGMPTFMLNGVLVHFAAFKHHIGLYPPVAGDARLVRQAGPYAGDKGNLRFPLDAPIPYDLIERIVKYRVAQRANAPARRKRR